MIQEFRHLGKKKEEKNRNHTSGQALNHPEMKKKKNLTALIIYHKSFYTHPLPFRRYNGEIYSIIRSPPQGMAKRRHWQHLKVDWKRSVEH